MERLRPTTRIVDVDGVIVEHLGQGSSLQWKTSAMKLLPSATECFDSWEKRGDHIVLMTARPECCRADLENWLRNRGVFWHQLVMGVASGSRVLYNDAHPEYATLAVTLPRNEGLGSCAQE